jgi:hypothetical protein
MTIKMAMNCPWCYSDCIGLLSGALRKVTLASSIVFSAGYNPRLYN